MGLLKCDKTLIAPVIKVNYTNNKTFNWIYPIRTVADKYFCALLLIAFTNKFYGTEIPN